MKMRHPHIDLTIEVAADRVKSHLAAGWLLDEPQEVATGHDKPKAASKAKTSTKTPPRRRRGK